MSNLGIRGVDVRQTSSKLLFRAFLQDSSGAILTTGTTTFRIYELQDDGTLNSYDFNDNTFKTTALTTETLSATHRQGNNSTTNTGVWTGVLSTLTGFTRGAMYIVQCSNTGASPAVQSREFQYGSGQGDMVVDANGVIDSNITVMAADTLTASALATSAVTEIQSGLSTLTASQVWATAIEAGYTAEQLLKIIAASTAGKSSGNEDNAPVFRGVDGTTARITGTVDAFGNRITSTLVGT